VEWLHVLFCFQMLYHNPMRTPSHFLWKYKEHELISASSVVDASGYILFICSRDLFESTQMTSWDRSWLSLSLTSDS
jgi:hypothetical protein